MPELAEVEFYRKEWDCGHRKKIVSVHLNAGKRIFRTLDPAAFKKALTAATLLGSQAHGKQMLFRFSKNAWIGIHLGMSGKLSAVSREVTAFVPGKHDHLVLRQARQSLVFSDPRQFGRVLFHTGASAPSWWTRLPPPLLSRGFSLPAMEQFLGRHRGAPIKAVLLMQAGFPGIGNWMADEILWQAGIQPRRPAGKLLPDESKKVYRAIKSVCRTSLRTVGRNWGDVPRSWLFHRRWKRGGHCPKDGAPLRHATIGGRTTCWCPQCQPDPTRTR